MSRAQPLTTSVIALVLPCLFAATAVPAQQQARSPSSTATTQLMQPPVSPVTEAQRQAILAAATSLTLERLPETLRDAQAGSADAQLVLARAYETGAVVDKDLAQAFAWLQKAAEQGHPMGLNGLAEYYARGEVVARDDAKAIELVRRAADRGYAAAQNRLGAWYEEGRGVPKDSAAALSWYRQAADQGNVDAQKNLASVYNHGVGVRVDHAEAARWLRVAADQGDPEAQFELAQGYCSGQGVPRSWDECERWLKKASDQGYAAASFYSGKYHTEHHSFAAGPFAQAVADDYFRKSAQEGYALGALVMARRVRDREEAYRWLLIAAALEQRAAWREWAALRPWDADELRRELPKRLEDTRKKLSPERVAACDHDAQTFITTHHLR